MKNKKIAFAGLFCLAFTLLYLIFAAKPLGNEFQYEPEWEINISNPTLTESEKETYYFKLSNRIGFFDEDGKITHFLSYPQGAKASVSSDYYSVYDSSSTEVRFYNKDGTEQGQIKRSGFPFFQGNKIFIFLPGGSSFARCGDRGDILWTYEGVMPVTAFSARENFCAAGFSDGTIKVFDCSTGEITLDYAPGGSDFPAVLGLDISKDGNYIASVSGQEKQRFVLARKENTQVKIISHDFLPDELTFQTLVRFSENEDTVYFNFKGGMGFLNMADNTINHIKIGSRIISAEESNDQIFLLGKEGKTYTVYVIEKTNSLGGSFSFKADSAFIKAEGNSLFVGKDTSLSKIRIIKK